MDPPPRFWYSLAKWQYHAMTGAGNPRRDISAISKEDASGHGWPLSFFQWACQVREPVPYNHSSPFRYGQVHCAQL